MNGESDRPEDDGEQLQETTDSMNPEAAEPSAENESAGPTLEEIQAKADEKQRQMRQEGENQRSRPAG